MSQSFCVFHWKMHVLNFHQMLQSDLSQYAILIFYITEKYVVYNLFDLCASWPERRSFKIDDPCGTER